MEEQILLYYLKVCSIIFISIIFIIFIYFYYVTNKNLEFKKNIISISKGENIISVMNKNFYIQNNIEKIFFLLSYKVNYYFFSKYIHYGDFFLQDNISFNDLINKISKPSNKLNKNKIVEEISKKNLKKELSKYFNNIKEIEYDDILADTYYFQKNEEFESFYNRIKEFKKNYFINNIHNKNNLNQFSDLEIITIGSLIEKEGLDYDDKKNISSVIFNRLKKNMKLQIDATVIYALTNGDNDLNRKLYLSDLKINHPFNTYIINGLPPKPISYVGTKTIGILIENYKTDFLFYFFNNSLKKHIFSKNYNEHKKN